VDFRKPEIRRGDTVLHEYGAQRPAVGKLTAKATTTAFAFTEHLCRHQTERFYIRPEAQSNTHRSANRLR